MYNVVVAAMVLLGVILLLISPVTSIRAANMWLHAIGGSSSGSQYQMVMAGYEQALQILGGVILASGLYGFLRGLRLNRQAGE